MLSIIAQNPVPFILALVIGLVTAWWIWGRLPELATTEDDNEAVAAEPAGSGVDIAAQASAPAVPLSVAEVDNKPKIAAAIGEPDDLKRVKGIGPKLEKLCNSLGVMRFDQIAAWTATDVAEVDAHLGSFKGRIDRDEWVAQAKLLAAGDDAGHEAKYGMAD